MGYELPIHSHLSARARTRTAAWPAFASQRNTPGSFPNLELRGGHVWPALILDLDQFSSYEGFCHLMWERPGLLAGPNWTVERASNGHCHAVWALATPVHRGSRARPKPLYALARVSEYFTQAAQADPRYNGVLTHNPMKRAHQRGTFATHWGVTKRPIHIESASRLCAQALAHAEVARLRYRAT